jgi:hypothetical protein
MSRKWSNKTLDVPLCSTSTRIAQWRVSAGQSPDGSASDGGRACPVAVACSGGRRSQRWEPSPRPLRQRSSHPSPGVWSEVPTVENIAAADHVGVVLYGQRTVYAPAAQWGIAWQRRCPHCAVQGSASRGRHRRGSRHRGARLQSFFASRTGRLLLECRAAMHSIHHLIPVFNLACRAAMHPSPFVSAILAARQGSSIESVGAIWQFNARVSRGSEAR